MNLRITIFFLPMLVSLTAHSRHFVRETGYSRHFVGEDSSFIRKLDERAVRILQPLQISDSLKFNRVKGVIVDQYRILNSIDEEKKAQLAAVKAKSGSDENALENGRRKIEEETSEKLRLLHGKYLAKLSADLTVEQVSAVKDGMTFNVLSVTNKAYQDMIPSLTAEEKVQINTWLVEARELAMDASSAENKHRIFGKYKGRINNYLAKRGYDLQKERAAWNERSKR